MPASTKVRGRNVRRNLHGLLLTALLAMPVAAIAQQAAMVGTLGHFDVLNNTGEEAHGFEIQLEGISSQNIYRIFGTFDGISVNDNTKVQASFK